MSEITHNSTRDTAMPETVKSRTSPLLDAGPWLVFAAFAIVPLLASVLNDSFLLVIVTRIMIFALAALSLNFIMGYGALVSFGHAAYIGIGAYAVGILSSYGIDDLILQLVAAIVVAAFFALVTGYISLRTSGVYFIMITLAFGQMAFFFMVSLSAFGGDDGMTLSTRSTLFGNTLLSSNLVLFYFVLAVLMGAFFIFRMLVHSRFGRVLRGTRDNPVRMRAIGFSPFSFQLTAYVIAGVAAAIAGVLLANQIQFVSPAFMSWQRSGELIVMVVLGGMGTLIGPVLGATAFIFLEEVLAHFSEHWKLGLGLFLVLVVLFSRDGIGGLLRKLRGGSDVG
ncbi:branched-chain amino acid ABC transporter permease [Brucella sp. MAB-22]|uniref:branched-chain amino acid ABC transporter permease n=1 Tax=Brucella TaxID=234 RepID=UPI000F673140|nr:MULTISPECIES: branched-chain amino acid ABC transporter permease [Brucella]RRY18963.1 branched-chain amino acid ABC transporter permease [Brucella anthropi]UYT54025.1 branched-chain amino acid ABC transporter permease [Brucella sp. MAB-22]